MQRPLVVVYLIAILAGTPAELLAGNLHIRDTPGDIGGQPNLDPVPVYFSPDIRVRKTPDPAYQPFPQQDFVAVVEQRTLRVIGTAAPERFVLRVFASGAKIEVEYARTDQRRAPAPKSFPLAAFDRLELDAGGGEDFVNIIDAGQTLDRMNKEIHLAGGEGDNVVAVTAAPFAPGTAARLRTLLDLRARIEQIAGRSAAATLRALKIDAMGEAQHMRLRIVAEANAITAQADVEIFTPAKDLTDNELPATADAAGVLFADVDQRANAHQRLVGDLTRQFDPANGRFPPDDNSEPAADPSGREPTFEEKELRARARGEQSQRFALQSGEDAESQMTNAGNDIERAADAIQARVDALEARAEHLADVASTAGTRAETNLTTSAQRTLAIVAELRALTPALEAAGVAVRGEIVRATRLAGIVEASALRGTAASCDTPKTEKTYKGGSNFDFFLPISAPSKGWSIDGGDGFNILFGGLAADDIRGGSDTDVVFGLKGNDVITGGDGVDLLFGEFIVDLPSLTGDDCIRGEGGIDLIAGDNFIGSASGTNGGDDKLTGGGDTDLVFGDDVLDFLDDGLPGGKDELGGDDGIDLLFGCGGDDQLDGDDDIDLAAGNGGNDTMHGHDGRAVQIGNTTIELGNLMFGSPGDDQMHGGKGVDVMVGNGGADRMWGGEQVDFMFGSAGEDEMRGEAGGVVFTIKGVPVRLGNLILGNIDGDRMWGGGDLDVMLGEAGDDRLIGFDPASYNALGIDADILHGGDGDDYLEGDDEDFRLSRSIDFVFGRAGRDTLKGGANIDFLFGGSGDDTMEGDSNDLLLLLSIDLLLGGAGDDVMNGGNSLDVMFGQGGGDTMNGDDEAVGVLSPDLLFGGEGNDIMNGGSTIDLMFGGDGDDRMIGDSNELWQPLSIDFMFGGTGNDDMRGGNAFDLMFGQTGCDWMEGDSSLQLRISPDILFGGPDDDTMDGGVNPDLMFGGPGQDTMYGDSGAPWMIASIDVMFGGAGCDTMSGGRSIDFMWGNAGVDIMDGQAEPDLLDGGDGGDTMNGGDSLDLLFGRDGHDVVHGDSHTDIIDGGNGDDCLYGDNGPDVVMGDSGNDCIRGGAAPDLLTGGPGEDRVFGDDGMDLAFGANGNDQLDGGGGADMLSGGSGSDEAWGGPGPDLMFAETKHQSGASGLTCDCEADRCEATICVRKFDDRNGNGVEDAGESGLADWKFIVACPGCATAPVTLTTGASGDACALVYPGTCKVSEVTQDGWIPTTPTTKEVDLLSGEKTSVSFGNRRPPDPELCVRKFHDFDGDGVQDPGEPMLAGWEFDITGGGTTIRVTTGADGRVCVARPPGTYDVAEITQTGWLPTTPAIQSVQVSSGQSSTTTFGNRELREAQRLCVFKFDDRDGDGELDADEPALPGWVFQFSTPGVTTFMMTTDANGSACVELTGAGGVGPLQAATREQLQQGWTATTPPLRIVTVNPGETKTELFGNHYNPLHGTLCITKYDDRDRSGTRDATEPGLSGWIFDVTGKFTTPVFTDLNGAACLPLDAGRYTVFERTECGWRTDTVEQSAVVTNGKTVDLQFGNSVTECFDTELCILKFDDRDGDGAQGATEPGLGGWDFVITGLGKTFILTTGANGRICKGQVDGTSYIVAEQPKPGWVATTPTKIVVTPKPFPAYASFGNRLATAATGEVCISRFEDRVVDGIFDVTTEKLLPQWTYHVNNGALPDLITGPTGRTCRNYPEGTYTYAEVPMPGWTPTTETMQTITVLGGKHYELMFGGFE